MEMLPLEELLRRESSTVEWKRGVANELDVVRTLTAFANSSPTGGWVLCGVEEQRAEGGFPRPQVVGLTPERLTYLQQRIIDWCRHRRVAPPLPIEITVQEVEGAPERRLLIFYAPPGDYPHSVESEGQTQHFVRVGDETRVASGPQLVELFRRKRRLPPFLEQAAPAALEDLDRRSLEAFVAGNGLPGTADHYLTPGVKIDGGAQPLVVADAVGRPVPTYFALLLFGHHPERFLNSASGVRLSFYRGRERGDQPSQFAELYGPIPLLIRSILERLELYLGVDVDRSAPPGGSGPNRPRYSPWAIREALTNAFAHRDYEIKESVRVAVFADRIEISNPGGLEGIDPARFRESTPGPHWRNPALAAFLVRFGEAQNEGQGIPIIRRQTRAVSGRDPEFVLDPGRFTVRIPALSAAFTEADVGARKVDPQGGLILVAIGSPSIREAVDSALGRLGLEGAEIALDYVREAYLPEAPEVWLAEARAIRDRLRLAVENPRYSRFHLFFKGPLALAPLIGALVAPAKPLDLYAYDKHGRYQFVYTLDREFLKSPPQVTTE